MIYGGTIYLGRKLRSRMIGKIHDWYRAMVDAGMSDEANAILGDGHMDTFGELSDLRLREIYDMFHKRQRARMKESSRNGVDTEKEKG